MSENLLGPFEHWPSRLIYSNLYKVAPHEGGNPGSRLCKTQQQACEDHLVAEIEMWKPKRVLFITGWYYWAQPFVDRWSDSIGQPSATNVEWTGIANKLNVGHEIQLLVCVRPERRKEQPLAEAILQAFTVPAPNNRQVSS